MKRRAGNFLLPAAAVLFAMVITLLTPGLTPWSPPATAAEAIATSCEMTPFALDPADTSKPNPNKEVSGAFGPAVTARGEKDVKAELKERRSCGTDGVYDTYLTAAHYSEWSHYGLTSVKVGESTQEINAFADRIKADPELYKTTLAELEKLEGESTYSEAPVSRGIWSLYMMPDGNGGVDIKVGRTSSDGTNAVFTHGDVQVRYRLDCGFQPNREGGFPGIDECTGTECAPPPVCPEGTNGTWPNCYVPCPWDSSLPKDSPNCLQPKQWENTPKNDGWTPDQGTGKETDGKESQRQKDNGDTRGNAGDHKVPEDTKSGDTTPDTPRGDSGPTAPGAQPGGDNQNNGAVDEKNTNQDDGGTNGDTCVPDPIAGITC